MIFRNFCRTLTQATYRINGSTRSFHSSAALISEKHCQLPLLGFMRYIHTGKAVESETGMGSPHTGKAVESGTGMGSVDFIKDLLQDNPGPNPVRRIDYAPLSFQDNRNSGYSRNYVYQSNLETNADIVHIKLMRNNAFVTVTDSNGNKKAGISTGKLAGKGTKIARYSAEAAAENMGREVRRMKTKSVVVKVNGFTFFRKKKDAILSFKDGYTNSRAEGNPIVYIEDTTRKPHNGCRRKKQRRI